MKHRDRHRRYHVEVGAHGAGGRDHRRDVDWPLRSFLLRPRFATATTSMSRGPTSPCVSMAVRLSSPRAMARPKLAANSEVNNWQCSHPSSRATLANVVPCTILARSFQAWPSRDAELWSYMVANTPMVARTFLPDAARPLPRCLRPCALPALAYSLYCHPPPSTPCDLLLSIDPLLVSLDLAPHRAGLTPAAHIQHSTHSKPWRDMTHSCHDCGLNVTVAVDVVASDRPRLWPRQNGVGPGPG
jgi:hypothetical protein